MQRGRGRRQGVSAKQQIAALKRSMHGHQNRLRHVAPPQVTRRPWYNLVLDFVQEGAGTETSFTPSDLINTLCSQLGLPSAASSVMNIKVHRVDVYCVSVGSSTDRPACALDVSAVTPTLGDPTTPGAAQVFYSIIKKLADQGNLSEAAKCSYTWPSHMADQPLSSQSVFQLVASSGNMANTLTRFHLLWATSDTAAPIDG